MNRDIALLESWTRTTYVESSEHMLEAVLGAFDVPLVLLVAQRSANFPAQSELCYAVPDVHELSIEKLAVHLVSTGNRNKRCSCESPHWCRTATLS